MLARWLAKLQQFHFDIIHRPGAQHGNADGLSRCPQCERGACTPNINSDPSDPEQPYASSCIGSSLDSELIPLESGETCVASAGRSAIMTATHRQKRNYDSKAVARTFPIGCWTLRYYPPARKNKVMLAMDRPLQDSARTHGMGGWYTARRRCAHYICTYGRFKALRATGSGTYLAQTLRAVLQ